MMVRIPLFLWLLVALTAPTVHAGEGWQFFCQFKKLLSRVPTVPLEVPVALLKAQNPATKQKLLLKEMPETWLGDDRAEGIHYFSTQEKEEARIYVSNRLLYSAFGELLDLPRGSMFVMDAQGFMYALSFDRPSGRFHHSSFLSGGPVAAAGGISVKGGKIVKVDNGSGHYTPRKSHLLQVRGRMAELGVELPLERMFVYGSDFSFAEPIHLEQFSDARAFYQKIHAYDPEDWPVIVNHCLKSEDEPLRQAAIALLSGNNGHHLDPSAIRPIIERGLADSSRLVQEDAAMALSVWNRRESPLDLYDLMAKVSDGPYSPRAKADALGALSRYHGGARPFALVERILADPKDLTCSAYGSLYHYLKSVSADPGLGGKAASLNQGIKARLLEWEKGTDKRLSEEARWALRDMTE